MAQLPRERPTSLSSKTWLSPTSAGIEKSRPDVRQKQYRREEVIDGNAVRIVEARRRRRPSPSWSSSRSRHSSSSSSPLIVQHSQTRDALLPGSTIETLTIAPSPTRLGGVAVADEPTSQPRTIIAEPSYDDFQWCEKSQAVDGKDFESSRKTQEPPLMPPRPSPQRLPTPDLVPLKMEVFCPCCPLRTGLVDLWAEFEDESLGGCGVLEHREG
jgi:hypothetical protein